MHNWSVNEDYLRKYPKQYQLWKLEQLLTYGLGNEKIDKEAVIANWPYLKGRLDSSRRKFIEHLLWPKQS